jgi:CopG family nickel-responsive transcriptional regulator
MSELTRMSFSIERALADKLEELMQQSAYGNRSEFLRDMIRERLVRQQWEADRQVVGSILLIYDHHQRLLSEKLTDLQHRHHDDILASTHVHLDHRMCAEVIIMRGRAGHIRAIADQLRQQRGVLHASISLGSTGQEL